MTERGGMRTLDDPPIRVAVLGQYEDSRPPRAAIEPALRLAGSAEGCEVICDWLSDAAAAKASWQHYDALFIAPGAADEPTAHIFAAITYARRHGLPCLGTCGGFQRMLTEFARQELGYAQVAHAEVDLDAPDPLFIGLACQITGTLGPVILPAESAVAKFYQQVKAPKGQTGQAYEAQEVFYCRYGVNPVHLPAFEAAGFKVVGYDPAGETRVMALVDHPFFVGTLFVPQVNGSEQPHALLRALLTVAVRNRAANTQVMESSVLL